MVEQDDKKMTAEDIEYVAKMDQAIKGKQEQPIEQQPKKAPLRKRVQEAFDKYSKEQQEKRYQKQVVKKYFLNFYIQDATGIWQLYKTVNKHNKKEVKDTEQELIKAKAIFQEIEGDPAKGLSALNTYAGRLASTWKENLQETGKEIQKEYTKKGGFSSAMASAFETSKSGMPEMAISVFGSMFPPKDIKKQYPSYQNYQPQIRPRAPKQKKLRKQYVSHEEYLSLLQQGISEADLEASNVEDKRSRYFQEQSPFGRMVSPYKPLSAGQLFAGTTPRYSQTDFQKRLAEQREYENFYPPFAGEPDENGNSTLIYKPPIFREPGAPRPLFRPFFAGQPVVQYDEKGNPIAKKKLFTPPTARL
jgi:hypothetical protein